MKKRFISLLVVLSIFICCLPTNISIVMASTNGHTQQDAVNWVNECINTNWGSASNTPNYDGSLWTVGDLGEPQCVDLAVAYWEYLTGQRKNYGNASDYCYISNLPNGWYYTNTPSVGDIVVWDKGSYGHIGIVNNVSGNSFYFVDTNGDYNYWIDSTGYRHNTKATQRGPKSFSDATKFIHPDFSSQIQPQSQGDYVGDDFYAYIINNSKWIYVAANNNNVELGEEKSAIMRDYDPKQIWHFIRKNNYNQYEIINEYDGKALDINSTELCTNVQTYQRNNTAGQLWILKYKPSGSGEMTIHPALNPDMALDVAFGVYHGNNIQIYTANSCDGQLFAIYDLSKNGYQYAVPKPAAPIITSAYSYGNVLNLKWTESPQVNIFDNDRRYEVKITDSKGNNVYWDNVGNVTEFSHFLPNQGYYNVYITAISSAYNVSARYNDGTWATSQPLQVYVDIAPCASLIDNTNGNAYLLFDTNSDYNGAKEYCESLGGHLATITSAEEQEIIADLCKSGNNENYWLGGTDEASEGVWKWITGEKWSYTNWEKGEPSNLDGLENYLHYMKQTNSWNDTISSSPMGFVCEIEQNAITSSVKKEIKYNGHKYILFDQSLPWTEAKKYCESVGGHLVTINSADENGIISSLISNGTKSRYWLGATSENDNQWLWVTDEALVYTNWNKGEPNNDRGIEKYAHIYVSEEKDGLWNDAPNYSNLNMYGFVCEIDKITPTTQTTVTKKPAYSLIDIAVENAEIGTNVIVAMYDKGRLSDIQTEVYDGSGVSLATFSKYDKIKVMLWESLSNLKPLGNVEMISN